MGWLEREIRFKHDMTATAAGSGITLGNTNDLPTAPDPSDSNDANDPHNAASPKYACGLRVMPRPQVCEWVPRNVCLVWRPDEGRCYPAVGGQRVALLGCCRCSSRGAFTGSGLLSK